MGTRTISIMDDVYGLLVRNKKYDGSFSEELRRLVPKKGNIIECAGYIQIKNRSCLVT